MSCEPMWQIGGEIPPTALGDASIAPVVRASGHGRGRAVCTGYCSGSQFWFCQSHRRDRKVTHRGAGVLHDTSLSLLYDCAHVSIKPEQWGGERLWVHRHGASRALPPSQLAEHPVFGATGQRCRFRAPWGTTRLSASPLKPPPQRSGRSTMASRAGQARGGGALHHGRSNSTCGTNTSGCTGTAPTTLRNRPPARSKTCRKSCKPWPLYRWRNRLCACAR